MTKKINISEVNDVIKSSIKRTSNVGDSRIYSKKSILGVDDMKPTSIPYAYNVMGRFIDNPSKISVLTMDRMIREDPVIAQSFGLIRSIVSAYIGKYQHEDKLVEDFVEQLLRHIPGGIAKVKSDLLSACGYGFAVLYKQEKPFLWRGEYWNGYKNTMLLPHVSIRYAADHEGSLDKVDGIRQSIINPFQNNNLVSGFNDHFASQGNMPFPNRSLINLNIVQAKIRPDNCIHFALRGNNGVNNPYGESLCNSIYNDWVAKTGLEQFYLIAIERKIAPLVTIYCNPKMVVKDPYTDEEKKLIDQAKETIGYDLSDLNVIYMDGMKNEQYLIETLDVIGDVDEILKAIEYKNNNIRQGLCNPHMLGNSDAGGSYAMALLQDSTWGKFLEDIRDQLIHVIIEQLIKPMIIKNFGEMDDYGTFETKVLGIDEKLKYQKYYEGLLNTGVMNPENKDHLQYVLDSLSVPIKPSINKIVTDVKKTNQTEVKSATDTPYAKTEPKEVN